MPRSVKSSKDLDTGLICLSIMARFFGLQADPDYMKREFGSSNSMFGSSEILRAAKSIDLKAKDVKSNTSRIDKIQLPAIAKHVDGHYFVIAKLNGEKILIHDPLEQRPLTILRETLEHIWSGSLYS